MSPSDYESHPLRSLLARLSELANLPEFTDPDLLSTEVNASALGSIFAIVASVRLMFDKSPALLVSEYGLAQLQTIFQSIFNELSAYQSNKNPGHIQNAKSKIEQSVMPNLWALGPTPQAGANAQLIDFVNQSTKAARDAVKQLVNQRDALKASQSALTQQVQESKTRLESLAETVAKQKAEAASAVADVNRMYAEKEVERISSFSTTLQELRAAFATFQADSERIQSEKLESLNKSKEEAARIVQVVGNTGITGNYQKIAVTEGTQANFWRWVTVAFFIVGIGIAVVTFWKFLYEPFSPETAWSALIRLVYAVAITAPA